MTGRNASRAGTLLLLGVSLALVLGAAELLLRRLELPERRGPLAWTTSVDWSGDVNSLGFRGKEPVEPKRGTRILLLGDSQLEGYHVSFADTFATKLQQYLQHRDWPVEVLPIGAGGWGTDQQLIALRMYMDALTPDIVLVFYTPQNDGWNSLFPTHLGTPKPTFRLQDGQLVPPDPTLWRAPGESDDGGAHYGLVPLVRRALAGGYPSDADWEAVLPPRTPAPEAPPDLPVLADVYAERFGLALWDGEDMQSERSHFARLKQPATPRLLHALALERALLAELRRTCEARGVPIYAFAPQLGANAWEGEFAHAGRAYRLSTRAADARLRETFAEAGVPLLEIHDLEISHTWLPKDPHLNPQGNRKVAEQVGEWLLSDRAARAARPAPARRRPRASFAPTPP